jgi:hypothetical protein
MKSVGAGLHLEQAQICPESFYENKNNCGYIYLQYPINNKIINLLANAVISLDYVNIVNFIPISIQDTAPISLSYCQVYSLFLS